MGTPNHKVKSMDEERSKESAVNANYASQI